MTITFTHGKAAFRAGAVAGLAEDLSQRLAISSDQLVPLADSPSKIVASRTGEVHGEIFWPFARIAYERRLLELIPANGLPSVNYDLSSDIQLDRTPLGLSGDFSKLRLELRPTKIAGLDIDFPLGVPASILTANASYLRYYADRGYCILTYKTVRSKPWVGHPFPQWVFLDSPDAFLADEAGALEKPSQFHGRSRYFPHDPQFAGMANSFGVPSHAPNWWRRDLAIARDFVRPGHQVLIASVMASVLDAELAPIVEDFVQTALMVKGCGVDIIELNLSCPNTRERAGEIYKYPGDAAVIAAAVRREVGATPIFVKIGYLADAALDAFFEAVAPFVDGIVAINTLSASVVSDGAVQDGTGEPLFPGPGRGVAGISGWPVQQVAQRMSMRLVKLRDEFSRREGKKLTLLGLGGVMSKEDFDERLKTGVDAVQVCTGAYLNPLLGFEIRNAQGKIELIQPPARIDAGSETRGNGALGRSETELGERASKRSANMTEIDAGAKGRAVDPLNARAAIQKYLANSTYEQRRKDFADWEPKLLADMDMAQEP